MFTQLLQLLALAVLLFAGSARSLAIPSIAESLFTNVYCSQDLNCSYGIAASAAHVQAASIAVNNNGQPVTGWDVVFVRGSSTVSPPLAYYAMGYAEGYTTSQRIYQTYLNLQIAEQRRDMSAYVSDWVSEHVAYMRQMVEQDGAVDSYWAEVGHLLQQVDGLVAGFNAASALYNIRLEWLDVFLISFVFEIGDVVLAMERLHGSSSRMTKLQRDKYKTYASHCSALIKPVGDDLLVTHTTWSSLESMLRQYKIYQIGSYAIAFSSYPGTLHSGDDFYVTSTGFAVLETTNENYNNNTAPYVIPRSVSEFIRVMVSNKVATNGSEWGSTFCSNNSGTYNNQWMIVDMKRISEAAQAKGDGPGFAVNGSLQVIEQMPNLCISHDQSTFARNQSYWSSFNRPFYEEMYHWAGTYDAWQQYGNYFSYYDSYRRLIFARNESQVRDVASLQELIRYNNYLLDPLSVVPYKGNCTGCATRNAELSISARADLTLPNESWGDLNFDIGVQDLAGIDGKIVSMRSLLQGAMNTWVVNGPTSGGQSNIPVFAWNESLYANVSHFGIPAVVNFPWVDANAQVLTTITAPFPPLLSSNVTLATIYDVPVGSFEATVFGLVVSSVVNGQLAPVNMSSRPPRYARGGQGRLLFAEDATSVSVQHVTEATPTSSTVVFSFEGPSAVQFTNIFARTLNEDLAEFGLSPVPAAPAQGQDASGRSNTTIIAVGCAVAAVVLLSVLTVAVRSRRRANSLEDAAMKDVAYSKLA